MATIVRLSVKGIPQHGPGLPKPEVPFAQVTRAGLAGDFNRYRHERLADDPDSAVLLMPIEVIETLNQEGWPVAPGDLGENLTTRGLPYERLAPGVRLRTGDVRLEVTRACDPCHNLYSLPYVGESRGPEFLRVMMGRRGWYAKVLAPGRVGRGDPITPEPRLD